MPARERAVVRAPGRVNLIGEHTDYNGGLCLPFAIERGITVTAQVLGEARIEAHAEDLGEADAFELEDVRPRRASAPAADGEAAGWRALVRGVVAELSAADHPVRGARLRLGGDLPRGAGLSSSAALTTGIALALLGLSGAEDFERLELARLCSRVENEWMGARTGLLDQLAVLLGVPGKALRLDLRQLDVREVALELGDWKLVTLDSGARRDLAAGGYNRRREECAAACRLLGIESLREVEIGNTARPPEAALGDAARLPEPLDRRVRHVVAENARVERTVAALADGDLAEVGALLDASHASLRDDYDVSVPAVEATVRALKEGGAAGARMVGGGFGGSVLALFGPAARPPAEAIEVRPAGGARLV